jgi:hypothetical protein
MVISLKSTVRIISTPKCCQATADAIFELQRNLEFQANSFEPRHGLLRPGQSSSTDHGMQPRTYLPSWLA